MPCIQESSAFNVLYSGTVPHFPVFSGIGVFKERWPDILWTDCQVRFVWCFILMEFTYSVLTRILHACSQFIISGRNNDNVSSHQLGFSVKFLHFKVTFFFCNVYVYCIINKYFETR